MNYLYLKIRQKNVIKINLTWFYLINLLKLLASRSCFCYKNPIVVLATDLIVDLTIIKTMSIISKITISLSR